MVPTLETKSLFRLCHIPFLSNKDQISIYHALLVHKSIGMNLTVLFDIHLTPLPSPFSRHIIRVLH